MTDEELYRFAQRLLPPEKRVCPVCRGAGRASGTATTDSTTMCVCGGSGRMTDNHVEMRKRGYRRINTVIGLAWESGPPVRKV